MEKIAPRERILTNLQGKQPDQVPWCELVYQRVFHRDIVC